MDGAIAHQLNLLGSIVIDSWQAAETSGQLQQWGNFLLVEPASEGEPVAALEPGS